MQKTHKTLHEAILDEIQYGNYTSRDIAEILNVTKEYEKKDLSDLTATQIRARVNNYPNLFTVDDNGYIHKKEK